MFSFDEIPSSGTLKPLLQEERSPEPGDTIEGRKIKRVKDVSTIYIRNMMEEGVVDVNSNLRFIPHSRRSFVFWMVEIE